MVEKGLQQLPECSSGVLFNQFLHTGDVFWCPRVQRPTGADSLLQDESATLDLTAPTLDGAECRAGLREGDGEVLMDICDGFPEFVANQSVGAKVWILHYAAADRQSYQNLAGKLYLGCLGKMQDGFQPKIAQETRYH